MHVLSLAGGGILGYGQAITLDTIEQASGIPCHSKFDMIGGTSVGSIVGAPLAIGLPASAVRGFFTKSAPLIFSHSCLDGIKQMAMPRYNGVELETALQAMLGSATLADCKTRFIAVSYDYATDRPVYFKSFEPSSEGKNFITIGYDSPIELWQVCRASAAAQSYFPGYQFDDMVLLDGGNTGDNAPDVLLIAENTPAFRLGMLDMLSLGTGTSNWKVIPKTMVSPGIVRVGVETIKIVFSAGVDGQVYKAQKMLGIHHSYSTPDLGDGIAIDDVSQLANIAAAANRALAANSAVLEPWCRG